MNGSEKEQWDVEAASLRAACLCLEEVLLLNPLGSQGWHTNLHVSSSVWGLPLWALSHNTLCSVSLQFGIFACCCPSPISLFIFLE